MDLGLNSSAAEHPLYMSYVVTASKSFHYSRFEIHKEKLKDTLEY